MNRMHSNTTDIRQRKSKQTRLNTTPTGEKSRFNRKSEHLTYIPYTLVNFGIRDSRFPAGATSINTYFWYEGKRLPFSTNVARKLQVYLGTSAIRRNRYYNLCLPWDGRCL